MISTILLMCIYTEQTNKEEIDAVVNLEQKEDEDKDTSIGGESNATANVVKVFTF